MKFHPCAEIFPLMQGAEFEALVLDIKANGLRQPIILYEEKVLDGRNRWRACEKAGVEPKTKNWLGDDPLAYVISLNLTRRHLNEMQREMVAARIATLQLGSNQHKKEGASPEAPSQEDAADRLNVSRSGVQRAKLVLEKGTDELKALCDAGKIQASVAAKIAKGTPAAQHKALDKIAKGTISSSPEYDGDTWETPDDTLELVRAVLGTIDLDPASNTHAQKRVQATHWLSAKDNALEHNWVGNVFCNPPYSMPLIAQFTSKLIAEYDAGRIKQAIYLVNNCTDAGWCQTLLRRFSVCFTCGRISFLQGDGQKFATRQGQAIFYLGKHSTNFCAVFGAAEIGTVLQATP
jgi:phage N-6-adenine-methyltransferase